MKKTLLASLLISSSFALFGCGSSSSGGGTAAVTPLTCASSDTEFGCVQTASCDPNVSDCRLVTDSVLESMSCRGICRPGEIQTPAGCYAQHQCGECSADVNGVCSPGLVTWNGQSGGHPRFVNGHMVIEFPKGHHAHRPTHEVHRR